MKTDEQPAQGHVSISFEVFDYKGVRTNIIKDSFLTSGFIDAVTDTSIVVTLQRLTAATAKEILTPSQKTPML